MKVLSYNQMFAGKGTLSGYVKLHFWHNMGKPHIMRKHGKIKRTIKVIKEINPDILGLTEILGSWQEKEIKQELKKLGYKHFHTGVGHGWPNTNERVTAMIATKMPSRQIPVVTKVDAGTLPGSGGGGGIVHIHIPKINTDILLIHMAIDLGWDRQKRIMKEQIDIIQNFIKQNRKRSTPFIIMGDFNMEYKKVNQLFKNLQRFSVDEPTCSFAGPLRRLYCKDIDHIIGDGFKSIDKGLANGASDHRGVWAEIQ